MLNTLLRLPAVKDQCGHSRSTVYQRIAQGLWTKPVCIGPRSVAWPASEVSALNAARISGKSDADIRALVMRLQAARALAQSV